MALSSAAIVQGEGRREKATLMLFELFWIQMWISERLRKISKRFCKIVTNYQKIPQNEMKKTPKQTQRSHKTLKTCGYGGSNSPKSCCSGVAMGEILWIFYVIFLAQISNIEMI